MEERKEVSSHRMEIWLALLLLGHLRVLTYGHPILKAPDSVTGTWKGDVTFQCIYVPMRGYSQVLVKWLVQHGSDPVTIFLRDSSGDHIQQAKYRERLKVSHKVPGDVSLQLNALHMDDSSHYTCEVTWQTPDGNKVTRDKIIELRVQKYSSNPRKINTEAPTTMQSALEATTTVKSTFDWTTKGNGKFKESVAGPVNGKHDGTTAGPENENHEKAIADPDSSNPRKINTEAPTTMQSALEATTTVKSTFDWTTKGNGKFKESVAGPVNGKHDGTTAGPENENHEKAIADPGRGLPIAIIFIMSLGCVVVITIAYIMFRRRKFQQEHVYEVTRVCARETSNSEETTRVTTFSSGHFSDEPDSHALINDYSDEPCLGQEYQIITQINNDYSYLFHTAPRNYEVLATEDNNIC
ncbi:V-set and immunoglobulin domain-containing protein 4 [Peromyscus leucopus]|uniref:V-set and immunoglobulin domain-containing protein 4 n=1 Tax=Peromyscus leucopus TaxID=10041 RepID=UPI0010A1E47A|nr:V-set and immunoglobulin domain-containing protein 4 [Peromyscus leucopus]